MTSDDSLVTITIPAAISGSSRPQNDHLYRSTRLTPPVNLIDTGHLEPMLQRIAASAGALPNVMTLDAGYWSEGNADLCADQGIDAYIATGRLPHGQPPPPKRGPLPRDADAKTRMARKLRSKKGSRIYAQR